MFEYKPSMEAMTDSPAISSEENGSPSEDPDNKWPNLQILTGHEDNGLGNDHVLLTGGLLTGPPLTGPLPTGPMTNWIRDDHLNDVDDSKPGLPDNSVDPQLE
ncbi:MAG: hypothetical protein M1830_003549, partial [Pleopsidium flavum]